MPPDQPSAAAPLRTLLEVEDRGSGRWLGAPGVPLVPGTSLVPGTQLCGQLALVATRVLTAGPLRSLHVVFARPVPLLPRPEVEVTVLADGRRAASAQLSLGTGGPGAPCVSATALALAPQQLVPLGEQAEPAHALPRAEGLATALPAPAPPRACHPLPHHLPGLAQRAVDDTDLMDPAATGPALARLWVRAAGAPDDGGAAALAYATEPVMLGPALLPHPGWSVAQTFTRFAASVVSHSLWFHAPLTPGDWWLLEITSPHLAGGRAFGRADVRAADGTLLASVAQEALLRPLPTRTPTEALR